MESKITKIAVTPTEAAALLGVKPRTLLAWRQQGIGPRWARIGGVGSRVLYRICDLEEWIAARTKETADTSTGSVA